MMPTSSQMMRRAAMSQQRLLWSWTAKAVQSGSPLNPRCCFSDLAGATQGSAGSTLTAEAKIDEPIVEDAESIQTTEIRLSDDVLNQNALVLQCKKGVGVI